MDQERETIVAIATPPGRGGIGIVRVSGPEALAIVAPLLRLTRPLIAGQARFAQILDVTTGELLDESVVTFFAAPHSYTAEDVVEIAAHGSPVLLEYLLRQCCVNGARLAEAGEFTQRAFLAGRLDLTQAEAVQDLIESSTLEQARVAARQLGGALSRQVQPAKERLVLLIATLEAGIDFAEDDIDLMASDTILPEIAAIASPLAELEQSFAYGRIVREGFRLAIVGRPNAGKSSLFNRLLERNRAIVTPAPGTTRDLIAERMSLGGIPVELMDTAGLRTSPSQQLTEEETPVIDEAERLGIARSREAMAESSVLLLVVDATAALGVEDISILRHTDTRTLIVVLNKIDLQEEERTLEPAPLISLAAMALDSSPKIVRTSALTGAGIEKLRQAILSILQSTGPTNSSVLVTNLRQHQALAETLRALEVARRAVEKKTPHEMLLLDLYGALLALDSLTGATTTDDILHLIFGKFCIGK
ncbi:MAG: tRNA uridine-5-carboxymethylaminomethyl(34) synthesis GTPase MnmE [Granulicella sp.]